MCELGSVPQLSCRLPAGCSTSARGGSVVSGIQLGNVFIGVQARFLEGCCRVLWSSVHCLHVVVRVAPAVRPASAGSLHLLSCGMLRAFRVVPILPTCTPSNPDLQPLLGVEGDPMRLLFERDLTPHPQVGRAQVLLLPHARVPGGSGIAGRLHAPHGMPTHWHASGWPCLQPAGIAPLTHAAHLVLHLYCLPPCSTPHSTSGCSWTTEPTRCCTLACMARVRRPPECLPHLWSKRLALQGQGVPA